MKSQTKKQSAKSFDIKRGLILVGANLSDIMDSGSFLESYYRFIGLAALTNHQPGCETFRELNIALSKIERSQQELHSFWSDCAALKEGGDKQNRYTPGECHAMEWFQNYYEGVWGKSFWEVRCEFEKFLPWATGNPRYEKIINAMRQIVDSSDVFNKFALAHPDTDCETVRKIYLKGDE